MIANCPNLVGVKTVALGNGVCIGGAGGGLGAGGGMMGGCNALAGCCKVGSGAMFGTGFLPLLATVAIGYLGYKMYMISKDLEVIKKEREKGL
ncbi:MAG: hypothetical protein HQK49_04635 [Oligoflexia bacterium]|nr:hypothetical protein [Oligoflexia bacterium]